MRKKMVFVLCVFISCVVFRVVSAEAGASISITSGSSWALGTKAGQSETASVANQWTVQGSPDGTENIEIKVVENTSTWTARTIDDPGINANTSANEFVLRENSSSGKLITGVFTTLKTALAMNGTYSFGLWFKTPPVGSVEGAKTLTVTLTATNWTFVCGSGSTVTFTYKGASVTYGTVLSQGRCWLDRNLGASQVATSSTDSLAYGDLFQWGRLDDGHQTRTSGTITTLSSADNPGHGNFIYGMGAPYDWRSPQNNNLWQGVSGINNPCPSGWRIPSEAEWTTEKNSWSAQSSAGAYGSPLHLSAAGCRYYSDAALYNVGSFGYCWSSTTDGTYARNLYFVSSGADFSSSSRANGFSVRCLKD